MKKFKKFLSILCAVSMILVVSVSTSAFASAANLNLPDSYRLDPEYVPERPLEDSEIAMFHMSRMIPGESGVGDMKYNPGNGTTGETLFGFQALTSSITFKIDWDNAEFGDVYNYQLYRVNGNGIPDTKIGQAKTGSFGADHGYTDLYVEAYYYIVVSSMDIPKTGAEVSWSYNFNE